LLDRLDACLSDSKVLSRSQRADKASKNVVQKGQSDIVGTLLTNQVTRTWAYACVATGCARPPIGGADRVLQAARNSYHWCALHSCKPNDFVGLSFESTDLARGPPDLSFRPARDLTHKDIWQLVSSLAQSAGGFDIAENFTVRVFKISLPAGRGRQSNRLTREDVTKSKM